MPLIKGTGTTTAITEIENQRVEIEVESTKLDSAGLPSFTLKMYVAKGSPVEDAVELDADVDLQLTVEQVEATVASVLAPAPAPEPEPEPEPVSEPTQEVPAVPIAEAPEAPTA